MPKNPLDAYKQNRKASLSGRDIEVAVLEKAAMNFRMLFNQWDESSKDFNKELDEAVKFNQRVWDIFQSDWKSEQCQLPKEIRQNLLSLSVYVRKSSLDVVANPTQQKITTLIEINENIASGLSEGQKSSGSSSESGGPSINAET
mgnify:CR=1 FL=1